jgi:hypothetical protein
VVIIARGTCSFTDKAQNAFNAGAQAVLIMNKAEEPPMVMGATDEFQLSIPVVMVSRIDGMALAAHQGKKAARRNGGVRNV